MISKVASAADVDLSRCTVLVVDDSPDNLALLSTLLQRHYRVKTSSSGTEALRMAASHEPPDLILLDVMMPDVDGYEVCRRLREGESTSGIPVIFLTGLISAADERRGLELGAIDYLAKPINPPLVLARTRNHLLTKVLRDRDYERLRALDHEKERLEIEQLKTERLLLNILPSRIADRLKRGEKDIAADYPDASILFCDIVGFTEMAAALPAKRVVQLLNGLFSRLDERAERLGLEKIKTIGDAWMAAAGLPIPRSDHAELCADMALGMFEDLRAFNRAEALDLQIRIGISTGPVTSGIVGHTKFAYDVWGHTVNTASRMESTSKPGRIQVSAATAQAIEERFRLEPHGEVHTKGVGSVHTFWLLGRR